MKKFCLVLFAAVAVAACAPKSTVLVGNIPSDIADEISIVIPELQIDTLIALSDGKFSVDLPIDITATGLFTAGSQMVNFIPDGTKLTLVLGDSDSETDYPKIVSSSPKTSVQERLNSFTAWMDGFKEEYSKAEDKDVAFESYIDKMKELVSANPDNALGLMGVRVLRGQIDAAEMMAAINSLSEPLQQNREIVAMKTSLDAAFNTAEGKMFTDFEVTQPDGNVKKLSDYVGNGKYVLADFWASWCGPCRREIPNIKAAYDKYAGPKFEVVSIAVWDQLEETQKAIKEEGLVWPQIVDAQRVPSELYGIEGIPHLILFGPDGTILKRGESLRGENLDKVLAGYIK